MPYKFKAVSANKILNDYSNKVIQKCRAIVAMGAGNQRDDVGGHREELTPYLE